MFHFAAPYIQEGPHSAVIGALKVLLQAGSTEARREAIGALEQEMAKHPQVEQPLTHHFTDGLYAREIFNPKGCLIITQRHKEHNFSFILRGRLIVITDEGRKELAAPAFFETKPGTKRVLYSVEDTVFVTVHPNPTNTQDVPALELRIAERGNL